MPFANVTGENGPPSDDDYAEVENCSAFGCVDSICHVSAFVDFSENVDDGTGMVVGCDSHFCLFGGGKGLVSRVSTSVE
jgi:hypothetical protein